MGSPGGTTLAVLAGGVLTWALWPESGPDPRSRVYTEANACLLTPADGATGKDAAPVWAGMQQASLATSGKVQYLEVDGPQTAENAGTYLATLIAGKCDLVLTAGVAPNAAAAAAAHSYPDVHFVVVGGGSADANVSVIEVQSSNQVTAQVAERVSTVLREVADDLIGRTVRYRTRACFIDHLYRKIPPASLGNRGGDVNAPRLKEVRRGHGGHVRVHVRRTLDAVRDRSCRCPGSGTGSASARPASKPAPDVPKQKRGPGGSDAQVSAAQTTADGGAGRAPKAGGGHPRGVRAARAGRRATGDPGG